VKDAPSSSSDYTDLSAEAERFMIFEGVVQWTQAVVIQSGLTSAAQAAQSLPETVRNPPVRRLATLNFHAECHYFAVAADMFWEFRKRAEELGLFPTVDFSEIDGFPWRPDHRDVRNMRTHITEYFETEGTARKRSENARKRWVFETPDFGADASSVVGTLIGSRPDWIALGAAASGCFRDCSASPSRIPQSRTCHLPRSPRFRYAFFAVSAR
jgi:hypothetical protein